MLDKDHLPIIGRKKAEIVPPHVFETPDGKNWAAQQVVVLGFQDADGNFHTINDLAGTIVSKTIEQLIPVLTAIFSPVKNDGGA